MKTIVKINEFNGVTIGFDGKEKINLTNLWKASGSMKNQSPYEWSRLPESEKFINVISKKLNTEKSRIIETTRGRKGGTWAHQQIALAYAKYLSPELHMFVNQCFFERVQEESNPDLALSRGKQRAIEGYKRQGKSDEWIRRRLRSSIATREDNITLAKHGVNKFIHSQCADAMNKEIIGVTAKKFKEDNNLPKTATVPDYLDEIQLTQYELSRLVSCRRIVNDNVYGNKECADIHAKVAKNIVSACEAV